MRAHIFAALTALATAGCASRYAGFREQDRTEFRRQDSSFVNRAVDLLVQQTTPFRSLPQVGILPKDLIVNRGDSSWLYHGLGVYVTFRLSRAPDACVPPSRMSFIAWKELPTGTGVDAVELLAAGDTSGMQDSFSATPPECNGPMLTQHRPMLAVGRVIDRQFRTGVGSTGRGDLRVNLIRGAARRCPAAVDTYFRSQNFPADCRVSWMQVWINTRIGARGSQASDTFFVSASVPVMHVWLDCSGAHRGHSFCPPLPYAPAAGQDYSPPLPPPRRRPALITVTGVIKDSEEGVPIPYARVRFNRDAAIYADSNGRFTAEVPPGRTTAIAECLNRSGSSGEGQEPFTVREYMGEVTFFLSRNSCARPPGAVRDSVFEGTFDSGLDRSRFSFCGNRALTVWARFTPQAEADRDERLPAFKDKSRGPLWLVWRVRGSLEGPGRLGPNGTADYLLTVERVLEIRVRTSSECYR